MPHRLRICAPSFVNLSILPELLKGHLMSDTVAILGSLDSLGAGCERCPTMAAEEPGKRQVGRSSSSWSVGCIAALVTAVVIIGLFVMGVFGLFSLLKKPTGRPADRPSEQGEVVFMEDSLASEQDLYDPVSDKAPTLRELSLIHI